ncbi:serine hydrolase domain-containing protein [Aerolutibacter daejeonensis]|nr:serine hydrolase domain-containing protein [Lysobacter daejeonensis]
MQGRTLPRVAGLSLSLALAGQACAEGSRTDATAARISDRLLQALADANGVPGMGAAVVRDGTIVWRGSVGYRDVEHRQNVDRGTVFRLASVSKAITATAAAKLMEQGALDVDAPVQAMLPWLDVRWAPLTPRQLAAHTSGLPHYQPVDDARGGVHYAKVRDAVAVFRDRELLSSPGTRYSYSSWGYTLLSAVIEARVGIPFLDFLASRVTQGLAIGPDATDTGNPSAARAYEFVDGKAVPAAPHDYSYTWAGGGLGATPEALARFGGRLMAGDVVAPATFEWMLRPTRLNSGSAAAERDYEVGFGWRVQRDADGDRIAHHAGVTSGARSALVLWPDRKLGVSLLSNAMWVSSIEQTSMLLAAPFKPVAEIPERKPCPFTASRYEGQFNGRTFVGTARFSVEGGLCTGVLSLPAEPLGAWLNKFPQKDASTLRIIGIDPRGSLSRAVLVTPIGLHELRTEGRRGYVARLATSQAVSLRFVSGINPDPEPPVESKGDMAGLRPPHA